MPLPNANLKESQRIQHQIYLKIPAQSRFLPILRDLSEIFCRNKGMQKAFAHNVMLCVDEAASNIIKHSYKKGPGMITTTFALFNNVLKIVLFHHGIPFDVSTYKEPDIKEYIKAKRKGGLGLYIIKNLMDNIYYYSKNGVNQIILMKHIT